MLVLHDTWAGKITIFVVQLWSTNETMAGVRNFTKNSNRVVNQRKWGSLAGDSNSSIEKKLNNCSLAYCFWVFKGYGRKSS